MYYCSIYEYLNTTHYEVTSRSIHNIKCFNSNDINNSHDGRPRMVKGPNFHKIKKSALEKSRESAKVYTRRLGYPGNLSYI